MIPFAPILGALGKVPLWAWALAAAVAWGSWHRIGAVRAKAAFQTAQVQAHAEHAAQLERDNATTLRRTKTIMEAADAATIRSQTDRTALDGARATLARVQRQLAADAADRRPAGAASAPGGATAAAADMVPAELLGRCGSRILDLAAYADAAATAGQACQRSYETLTDREEDQ